MNHFFTENLSEKPVLSNLRRPRILVAPLDWGLGHATRCIPIIKELLEQRVEVWIGAEAAQEKLLKVEFPDLPFLSLPGYRIRYGKSAAAFIKNILFQIPKILKAIEQENAWLKKIVKEYDIDAVIADNRYGLYHSTIPSVFITHQLKIKSSLGKWIDNFLQKRNYRYINRFTECWIPDTDEKNNLTGELAHPENEPNIPLRYIGLLSRFKIKNTPEKKNHFFIILSGPEPQRSILENKIIKEISNYYGTATIMRGLPCSVSIIPSTNAIRFYNHLPSVELNDEMQQAEYVISRSGYSTIMDIVKLQKKSILIPTPAQTEQEYLANYLSQKQIVCYVTQKKFSFNKALQQAKEFSYRFPVTDNPGKLNFTIASFVASLRNKKFNQSSDLG